MSAARAQPTTALPEEVAKFSAIADEWWDPQGKFKPLHKFNPERIRFVRASAFAASRCGTGNFAPPALAM